MRLQPIILVLAMILACCLTTTAVATPLFSIGEGRPTSWSDGVTSGNVVPVTSNLNNTSAVGPGSGLTFSAQQFYSSEGAFQQVAPQLTPDIDNVSDGSETHNNTLIMSWDESPGELSVAAWDYVYDVDPDLRNTKIHFSLFPPPGIWDFSLELIDANGFSRGWFRSGPPTVWGTHWIRPDVAAVQGPFNAFFDQPGFDVSQVIAIRLDEAGTGTVFPAPPPGAPVGPLYWNAWNHLEVTAMIPEPSSLTLCTGLVLFMAAAGRSRHRAGRTFQ